MSRVLCPDLQLWRRDAEAALAYGRPRTQPLPAESFQESGAI